MEPRPRRKEPLRLGRLAGRGRRAGKRRHAIADPGDGGDLVGRRGISFGDAAQLADAAGDGVFADRQPAPAAARSARSRYDLRGGMGQRHQHLHDPRAAGSGGFRRLPPRGATVGRTEDRRPEKSVSRARSTRGSQGLGRSTTFIGVLTEGGFGGWCSSSCIALSTTPNPAINNRSANDREADQSQVRRSGTDSPCLVRWLRHACAAITRPPPSRGESS